MLTKTPWYVSYSTLFPFVLRGNSKGISVFPAGTFPALATSMLLLISWIGCSWWGKLCWWRDSGSIYTLSKDDRRESALHLYRVVKGLEDADTLGAQLQVHQALHAQEDAVMLQCLLRHQYDDTGHCLLHTVNVMTSEITDNTKLVKNKITKHIKNAANNLNCVFLHNKKAGRSLKACITTKGGVSLLLWSHDWAKRCAQSLGESHDVRGTRSNWS